MKLSINKLLWSMVVTTLICLFCPLVAIGAAIESEAEQRHKAQSPWVLTPTLSNSPKLDTSIGFLIGYLVKFDDESPTSMLGVRGAYSTSDSKVGGVFARTYFGGDQHRLFGFLGGGKVYNDYSDFLGTGQNVETSDDLKNFAIRYLNQVKENIYLGVQGIYTNYTVAGSNSVSQEVLDMVGLVGFDSVALGLVGQYDTRDNKNSPTEGLFLTLHNSAYREEMGGEDSFDAYMADLRSYFGHGENLVLATKMSGRWTDGAPSGGLSSIKLRGYVHGQYLGKHMTALEIDERIPLSDRWGVALYAGIGCLYDEMSDIGKRANWYPSVAGGISYVLKTQEKMVVRLDVAIGEADNNGVYLNFGQPF